MFNLNDVGVRGGNFCLSKAGLCIGTSTDGARTNAPNGAGTDFVIDGVIYHLADADNNVDFTAATQTALYTNVYLVTIQTDNTITVTAGTEILTADLVAGRNQLHWPTVPAGECVLGAIVVDAISGSFVAGTDDLSDTNTVTVEYIDLFSVPVQPIRS